MSAKKSGAVRLTPPPPRPPTPAAAATSATRSPAREHSLVQCALGRWDTGTGEGRDARTWNSASPLPGYASVTSSRQRRNASSSQISMLYRYMNQRSSMPAATHHKKQSIYLYLHIQCKLLWTNYLHLRPRAFF